MPAFTRTILVLDQASGSVRTDDDRVVWLQLHPDATRWLERNVEGDAATVLALLTSDDATPAAAPCGGATPASGGAVKSGRIVGSPARRAAAAS